MTNPAFQSTQHHALTQHIEADEANVAGVLLKSGHTEFFSTLAAWDAVWLKGTDADGVPTAIAASEVVGYYLLDRKSLPGATAEEGVSADIEAWQTALMELRAAAEESTDERVSKAAARLARLEDAS
jgi:uncharacterized protein (DUF2336 family)